MIIIFRNLIFHLLFQLLPELDALMPSAAAMHNELCSLLCNALNRCLHAAATGGAQAYAKVSGVDISSFRTHHTK